MRRLILPFSALTLVLASSSAADIVINEILPNPPGDDVGTERIEIFNNGPAAIDVTGWGIDDAATIDETAVRARIPEDFDSSVCPASPLIGPGEYRVIMGQSPDPFLNNSGDDVYLITDRTANPNVVDVVTYGSTTDHVNEVWACVPDGSENFGWHTQSFCGSNGGGGDNTPPADITDLAAEQGLFPGEVLLTWTATGDDGQSGSASEYVIKVSGSAITSDSFDEASDLNFWINEPVPLTSGMAESLFVFGMESDSTYFFAVKAIDDASNASGVSNSPSASPTAGELLSIDFGLQTYFGNLHSHTSYSDGVGTPTDAYNYARYEAQTPLDFLAVTDHNHSVGGMDLPDYHLGLGEAEAANDDGSFVAIYGMEFGLSENGHANVFEAPVLFGWEAGNYDVFVAEGDYAGLYTAALANPPDPYPPLILWCHPQSSDFNNLEMTVDAPDVVKLICLVNGPAESEATDESDTGNTGFDDTFQDALRLGHRVSPTGDQDNHHWNWGASTESRTAILTPALSKTAIFTALSEGHNYATQDHNTLVGFSADGHVMGEAFTSGSGIRIAVEVTDPDPSDTIDQIELYRGITGQSNAARVAFNVGNNRLDWRETRAYPTGTEVHYYIRIRQGDTQKVWTAPCYVTYDGSSSVSQGGAIQPGTLRLLPMHPNPMTAEASIRFTLPGPGGLVSLDIVDVAGRLVRRVIRGRLPNGDYGVEWDGLTEGGSLASPGVYFVRLASPRLGTMTQKLVIVR